MTWGPIWHPERRRREGFFLNDLMARSTGWDGKMWGPSLIGYGSYHYHYQSGREGDFMVTGFAPRKKALSIYIMPGFETYGAFLAELGKHRTGKCCLYVNKLEDIDTAILEALIRQSVADIPAIYPLSRGG